MLLTDKDGYPLDAGTLGELESARTKGLASTAELLPWMFRYNEQIVVNKDSALMACFEYTGPDTDSQSSAQLLGLMHQAEHAFQVASRNPQTFWFITHRRRSDPYAPATMPDPYSQVVEDERSNAFKTKSNYINRHYLAVALSASAGLDRVAGRFFHAMAHEKIGPFRAAIHALRGIWSDQADFAYTSVELAAAVKDFEEQLSRWRASLPALTLTRLAGAELGGFLASCAAPAAPRRASVAMVDFLDESMSHGEVIPAEDYILFKAEGRKRIGVVTGIPAAHQFYPARLRPHALDDLLKVPGELTISHVYRIQDADASAKMIDQMGSYHRTSALDLRALAAVAANSGDPNYAPREDKGRVEAADETEDLKKGVSRGKTSYGQYTLSITSLSAPFHSDEVEAWDDAMEQARATAGKVGDALIGAKFLPLVENLGALGGWTASIPGAWRDISRWAPLRAAVVARAVPLRTVSQGAKENRHLATMMKQPSPALAGLPTDYGTPYFWTGFYHDIGHTLVSGETGLGKTTIVNLGWTLFRKYLGSDVFVFDRTFSSRIPIMMQGGVYCDPEDTSDSRLTVNPLSLIGEIRHLKFVKDWICTLAERRGYVATSTDREELEKAILATRQLQRKDWRLHAVYVQLPVGSFQNALTEWVGEALNARWFDNALDIFDEIAAGRAAAVLGIEMGKLLAQPDVLIPYLIYCFYRIQDRIESRRNSGVIAPTFIGLPEVWGFLEEPAFARKLAEWIDTLRKLLGCVWMDAQSPERYINSPIYASIRDNVPNRIILPYPAAKTSPSLRKAFTELGLNPQQIDQLAEGTPKQDYFLTQKDGFMRKVALRLDTRSLAVLRSELDAQALFDHYRASGREDWREAYFEEVARGSNP